MIDHAAGFIIRCKNKYLICHPFGHKWGKGNWSLPKGHIARGENALQAAARETKEECGIDINQVKGEISEIGTFTYPSGKKKITVFLLDSEDDILNQKTPCSSLISKGPFSGKPEIDLSAWVSKADALKKLHPASSAALSQIKDEKKDI